MILCTLTNVQHLKKEEETNNVRQPEIVYKMCTKKSNEILHKFNLELQYSS